MKLRNIPFLSLCIFFLFYPASIWAQYWNVWQKTHNITLGVSSDDKWVFFNQKNDAGIENIYKIELKSSIITPVTSFMDRPILSGIVLFGKSPAVVFTRTVSAAGNDIHLYRINVLTTDPPYDITPGTGATNKKIMGMACNGRYVYYTSDRGQGTKSDTYRYDTEQNITELVFANDKNYETIAWNRSQTNLLLHDPKTDQYYNYSIETTDKQKDDRSDKEFHGTAKVNISVGEKYIHFPESEKILVAATKTELPIPAGAFDLIVSPKETSVLYVNTDGNASKLYLYDIAKNTSKELTVLK